MAAIKKDKNTLRNQINSHQGFTSWKKKTVTELFSFQFQSQIKNVSPKGLLIIFVKIAGLV